MQLRAALCMERSDAQSAAGLRACGGAHHESTQLTSDEFSSTAGLSLSRLADLLAEALLVRGCADASGLCDSEGVLCEEETVGLGEAAMAAHDLPLPFGDGIVMGDEAGRCAGVDGGLSEGRGPSDGCTGCGMFAPRGESLITSSVPLLRYKFLYRAPSSRRTLRRVLSVSGVHLSE